MGVEEAREGKKIKKGGGIGPFDGFDGFDKLTARRLTGGGLRTCPSTGLRTGRLRISAWLRGSFLGFFINMAARRTPIGIELRKARNLAVFWLKTGGGEGRIEEQH